MSHEQKIKFMKNALASEGLTEYQVYDAKYAEDLINFGLKNDSAESIRLGESMLQELEASSSHGLTH